MMSLNKRTRQILAIAFPMMISQASETVMLFVDRLFLSRLGKAYISASLSGGLTATVLMSIFLGITGYTNALSAQYFGAERKKEGVQTIVQGLYLALFFYPITLLLIPPVSRGFTLFGHHPDQVALERLYFSLLMVGSLFPMARNAVTGYFLAVGKARTVMIANFAGMFINVPMNYLLIFGKGGFPELGIVGAALGTIAGNVMSLTILLLSFISEEQVRKMISQFQWAIARLKVSIMKVLLRYGLPAGLEFFINIMAFNLFVQMFHSLGPDVAAAVTITFNYDLVAFIPLLGVGVAVTSLVGRQIGSGDKENVGKTVKTSLTIAYSYSGTMALIFIIFADPMVRLFAGGLAGDDAFLSLSKTMLRMAALYTLADATQVIFSGALRGAGDTKWVLILSGFLHWVMAAGAFILINKTGAPPVTVWGWFIGFILVSGATMMIRFLSGGWKKIQMVEHS